MKYDALPHQLRVLNSMKKYIFMGGGVRCGKTDVGSLWVLKKCKETPKDVISFIAANSYTQLIDSTVRNMFKNFRSWGIKFEPQELPRSHRPFNIFIWNGKDWIEILCRSLDAYNLLSGTEVGWIWVDECFMTKKEAIDVLMARLSDDRMFNQMLMTTTLDDPNSWMYTLFEENFDPKLMDVFYASSYDNKDNLPDGYVDGLKATYTKAMFDRMVLAKWVNLEGSQIYYNFNKPDHVTNEAEFDPYLPILWSHDFNIGEGKPMSSCLCQIKKGMNGNGKTRLELHVFDEIVLETADTHDAVLEFNNRRWRGLNQRHVVIYGDASGRAKDTRSKLTDYIILRNAGFKYQKITSKNPPIRNRHNAVNALLKNAKDDIRLKIHPRCKNLIKGLETVHLKKGADYIEDETYTQHVTTALGYLISREFPIFVGSNSLKDSILKFWK